MALTLAISLDPVRQAAILNVDGVAGSNLVLSRAGPSGVRADVRGWAAPHGTAATAVSVRDYEIPLGVEVDYHAARLDAAGTVLEQIGPVPFEIPAAADSNPWLVDLARPLGSFQTIIESLPSLQHSTPAGVHRVLGRRTPVVTSDVAWTWSGELTFVTSDERGESDASMLLGSGVPFLIRTPPEQGVGNVYAFPLGFTVERASRIALHEDRRFVVPIVQVDRPDPALFVPQPPATYAGVTAVYATYAALLAARPTYDSVAYDYDLATPPIAPWPPEDV